MSVWIDTHCHLDAPEYDGAQRQVRARARQRGVVHCVIPAVSVENFTAVRTLAHAGSDSYALGIHPLFVPQARDDDLLRLARALRDHRDDPRLVAVGEIGLDFFVPALCTPAMRTRQEHFYLEQLKLARQFGLPVILHVRRSADRLLRGLRLVRPGNASPGAPRDERLEDGPAALAGAASGWSGIAHAFAGSLQQAQAFIALGFKLGFGGAVTFDRALRLRRLVTELPLSALVLETDAPDIAPHWLYTTAAERARGQPQGINEPAQLPAIGALVAHLRDQPAQVLAEATCANACAALPKLQSLLV